ncbi:MAG TPA: PIN domain-containing protein [Chitinophagaceae bacterium]|nr:PIN domain-containing protein [Chitinophagaceae bacterium]
MALKIFTDTNIVIDFLEQRPFELNYVNRIFELAENNEITVFVSESVITNALYLTELNQQIDRLLTIIGIICIDTNTFKSAMKSSFKDKEDGILYYGALHQKIDYFVTRNKKDFLKHSLQQLPVMGAKELINTIR